MKILIQNTGPIDALRSSGATKSQIISFGIIPQILPAFVANNLYILDRNVRMATIFGYYCWVPEELAELQSSF